MKCQRCHKEFSHRKGRFCGICILRDPLQDVIEERARQDKKWGEQNHTDLYWLGILTEELGELAQTIIEERTDDIYLELTQVTAVGLAWLECLHRKNSSG